MTHTHQAQLSEKDFLSPGLRLAGAGTAGLELTEVERSERLARMREGTLGSVHSWELVTAVDGPGTRMTIFFSGCPLRCQYCHNPDTMEMHRGQSISAEELLGRIKRYRKVFRTTGGGITLSGGEVLMQPAFAATLLQGAKEMGIHTAIDTSGFLGANVNEEMLGNIDLVLLDIKSGDEGTYSRVTGRTLEPTLRFARRLEEAGIATWVRFVLVPGLTDAEENINRVADIAAGLSNVERVEVLPFHQMGKDKWKSLGLPYTLEDTKPPSFESIDHAKEIFASRGLTVY